MTSKTLPFHPSCPLGGNFYVCDSSPSKFLGCCVGPSPCAANDGCSAGDLRPASFDASQHATIHNQNCTSGKWYTCANVKPPFMGCCSMDPCDLGCTQLQSAFLSSNFDQAVDFLGDVDLVTSTGFAASSTGGGSTNVGAALMTSAPSSSPLSTSPASTPPPKDNILSIGTSAGIAAGCAIFTFSIIVLMFLYRRTAHQRGKRPQINSGDTIEKDSNYPISTTTGKSKKKFSIWSRSSKGGVSDPIPPPYSAIPNSPQELSAEKERMELDGSTASSRAVVQQEDIERDAATAPVLPPVHAETEVFELMGSIPESSTTSQSPRSIEKDDCESVSATVPEDTKTDEVAKVEASSSLLEVSEHEQREQKHGGEPEGTPHHGFKPKIREEESKN